MIPLRFTQGDKSISTCLPCVPRVGESVVVVDIIPADGYVTTDYTIEIRGTVAVVRYVVNGGAIDVFCEVAP